MIENNNPNRDFWNLDDLRVYMLLYCANVDLVLKEEEQDYIDQKIGNANYAAIKAEFKKDNDFQSITKINESISHLGFNEKESNDLLRELRDLFLSDGKFDTMEKAMLRRLASILKK